LTASTKLPLVEGDNDPLVLKLSPPRTETASVPETAPKALPAGTAAPEWQITEWTDGSARKLADYRGKVVVLDFWGVWCGPCVGSIPAMKQLHERYKGQDVVFLGIHTAGTDMSLIKGLLKQQQWQAVTGLDVGDEVVSGVSVRAFAVKGFPTVMVIDRQGKIAFNSGDLPTDREQATKQFMKRMEEDAKSLGLPWPIDNDATEEQITERLNRLQVLHLSREIDRALKKDGQ
jgi:thiol-disulfide isomerase/thioredoxin